MVWTKEQGEIAVGLYGKGVPLREIGITLGKKLTTVHEWLRRYGHVKTRIPCARCSAIFVKYGTQKYCLKCKDVVRQEYHVERNARVYNDPDGKRKKQLRINERKRRFTLPRAYADWTEEQALELLEKFRNAKGSRKEFAARHGMTTNSLTRIFRTLVPAEHSDVVEKKKSNNVSYRKGRSFEYRVRDMLQDEGFYVLRSPQSKGPADLVAIKAGTVAFVQCKTSRYYFSEKEARGLLELAESIGASCWLAYRAPRKGHAFGLFIDDVKTGDMVYQK